MYRHEVIRHRDIELDLGAWRSPDAMLCKPWWYYMATPEVPEEALAPIYQLEAWLGDHWDGTDERPPIPLVAQAQEQAHKAALDLIGDRLTALERNRALIACHEAGHAVMYEAEGLSVGMVVIHPLREGKRWGVLGETKGPTFFPSPATPARELLVGARILLGGWGGEALYLRDPTLAEAANIDEVCKAAELVAVAALERCKGDSPAWFRLSNELWDKTRSRVVETLGRWKGIHVELAEKLAKNNERRLSGRAYTKVVRPIRGAVERRPFGRWFS